MPTVYQVSFFNNLVNSYGLQFKACQRTIVIKSARSPARAIKAAKLRFCRLEHVKNWSLRAQCCEAAMIRQEADTQWRDKTAKGHLTTEISQ